ncbi:MAG TPA: hypothetical protein VFH43_11735 [Candidatus Kapabacteria bacterium]|nr:hypothetical protein [Candidatus Kapabacteria bacterium]
MKIFKIASLFLAFGLASCAATNEPDFQGGGVTNTKPAIASNFRFHHITSDEGTKTHEDSLTYTTTVSPIEIKGKSGAYVFVNSESQINTRTIAYETNGNISILVPLVTETTQDVQWMTIPLIGSGGSKDLLLAQYDTTISGISTSLKLTATATLVSNQNMTVNGQNYTAKHYKITRTLTSTTLGIPVSTNDDDLFWWIPDLGFFGKIEEGGFSDPTGQVASELSTETLLRYSAQ